MKVMVIDSGDLSTNVFEVENTNEDTLREAFGLDDEREYERREENGRVVHAFFEEDGYHTEGVFIVE